MNITNWTQPYVTVSQSPPGVMYFWIGCALELINRLRHGHRNESMGFSLQMTAACQLSCSSNPTLPAVSHSDSDSDEVKVADL